VANALQFTFAFCSLVIAMMIVLALLPESLDTWRINDLSIIFPVAMFASFHILSPILLNERLILFTY
jgi:hypothetical protein